MGRNHTLAEGWNVAVKGVKAVTGGRYLMPEAAEKNPVLMVRLADSVTAIYDNAFASCPVLGRVELGNGLLHMGLGAFYNCDSLTSVTIPDSVTSIGDYAFFNCAALTSITIPDSVIRIAEGAFINCESLKAITLPSRMTEIEEWTFVCDCKSIA